MEGYVAESAGVDRPWQGDLCQFFTRADIARLCLQRLDLPRNLSSIRLLEPAAGQGAFILPLIPRLVRHNRKLRQPAEALADNIRAFEIDPIVAAALRQRCASALHEAGIDKDSARKIVRAWVRNEDFLEANLKGAFSHVVGNPPYIRWDAVPSSLRDAYRKRFDSFKQRADLYIPFIEKSLELLAPRGQLGFLCPGTWTRNVYGGSIREALTSRGHIKSISDFSNIDSFETPADAYPHFFVFQNGRSGATYIASMNPRGKSARVSASTTRQFAPSNSPLVLNVGGDVAATVRRARNKFPTLEQAGCLVRVGSATGSNETFLVDGPNDIVEKSRLLPFVNARSIKNGVVQWSGTKIVNVFDRSGKPVALTRYPRLRRYLYRHKDALKARAKSKNAKIWWRSIDALQPEWYEARKLLIVDISAVPVIGIDRKGCCAGGGVYQIRSKEWPLQDLLVFLSAGVLGLFVAGMASGTENSFHRFQKEHIAKVPLPRWRKLDKRWRTQFKAARKRGDRDTILDMIAVLYGCRIGTLKKYVARDWKALFERSKTQRLS
ncbi:adenine-specific DNA-methyltransferase [Bradyrhizobium diazoefficiens]